MFQTQKGLGNPYGEDTIDIKALLGRFLKRWYYFAIGLILFGSIGVYKIYTAEKIYAVKAKAILGDPNKAASKEANSYEGLFDDQSTVDDKIGVMTSYNLLRETVKALPIGISYYSKEPLRYREVFTGAPFQVQVDSAHVQLSGLEIYCSRVGDQLRIKGEGEKIWLYNIEEDRGLRELEEFRIDETIQLIPTATGDSAAFESDLMKFSIRYDKAWETYPDKEYFFKVNTVDGLVDMIQNSIKVGVAGEGSNIIDISMEGPVVDIQKMVINQLLVTYQQKELVEMKNLGTKTVIYLDSLIRDLSGETRALTAQITENMGSGIDPGNTDNTLLQTEQALVTSKGELESQLSYYVTIKERIEHSAPNEVLQLPTSQIGTSDQGLATLINSLSVFQEERIKMEATDTRGPKWELNEIQIQNTRRSILANVSSSVDAIDIRLNNIVEQINSVRRQKGLLPIARSRVESLTGDKLIKNEQLTKLRDRKLEAELAVENAKVDIEIIENARMDGNTPIKPKKPLTLLIFGFLGMVLPLAVILAQDFFDNKIASHEDIQSSTNLPVLGFIARHDRNSNYIVPKDSRTALAESFRSIRIKMQYLNDNVHQQVVGVTSSSSGEGKTFCVTNIAAIMAQAGKKTLLIDMDLRRPRVTRYFDNPEGLGLSNYLAGEVEDVKSIVAETHIENLYVIHSGPVATNPLDLIATDRMTHLMETFREEFDHIVLDAPPVGLVSDYLIIMKMTDFNIYVVRDSATTIESLKMINELYDSQKIKNIAMLINDVKSVSAYGYIDKHYGYGD